MTDGRFDYIQRTVPSALATLDGPITSKMIFDDSGDPAYRAWLERTFPDFTIAYHPSGRQGFGGAIREAWSYCRHLDERFIFHLEDDFLFNREVPLSDLVAVLESNPHLVQLALRRQPWNDVERAAGGVIETHPEAYTEATDEDGRRWLEHRLFFTTNPGVYRTDLTWRHPWPRGLRSEVVFTNNLLRSPRVRFGYWGARDSGEWVEHIGEERHGTGY